MKILFVMGTRPEAIKVAPLIEELSKHPGKFAVKICVTAQHREMLDQVLNLFGYKPDYDLNVMKPDQDLYKLTEKLLAGIRNVLQKEKPDLVLVQGDTTTAFVGSLAAFYGKIPVAHLEAGLRTYNPLSPFPEEINRQLISRLAAYHFAPTQKAKSNLLKEAVPEKDIYITGNTVIDALLQVVKKVRNKNIRVGKYAIGSRKIVLVTGHRRENFGAGFRDICSSIKHLALKNPDIDIVYPVHLNPNVQAPVNEILGGIRNIFLISPLSYEKFIFLMDKCYFILTDSGGIQEEAPSLGKPVLVMRETTERMEAIKCGAAKLVGTNRHRIIQGAQNLLDNRGEYLKMAKARNPYGDGKASERIVAILRAI